MKDTVVFDLDGTLLNTLDDLTDSMNYALKSCSLDTRSKDEIRGFVGNGIRLLVERAVPEGTDSETLESCYDCFCAYYKEHMEDKTRPYEGVNRMLANIKKAGFKTAIVTNKADFAAQDLCRRMFGNNIGVVAGSVDGRPNKPAPDGVFYALSKLGSKKENAVFVGDSDVDILTAENAGLPSIGVLWGFRDKSVIEAAGASVFAETPGELEKIILSMA